MFQCLPLGGAVISSVCLVISTSTVDNYHEATKIDWIQPFLSKTKVIFRFWTFFGAHPYIPVITKMPNNENIGISSLALFARFLSFWCAAISQLRLPQSPFSSCLSFCGNFVITSCIFRCPTSNCRVRTATFSRSMSRSPSARSPSRLCWRTLVWDSKQT